MKTAQQHAQEILPLVTAQANGEVIQMYVGDHWSDCVEPTAFVNGCEYRVKPKTILVNGFEVPEPMREAPCINDEYFTPQTGYEIFYCKNKWRNDKFDQRFLSRGLMHLSESAAIAHAKAMLGVDPNS